MPEPRFVVAFEGDARAARRSLKRWLGSRSWFADPALRRARELDLRGIYVPAYLYSAVAHADYHAQIAEHYTEGQKRKKPDGTTETRRVTRTEYRPLAGRHVGYVTDVLVSASAGLSHDELGAIEPYDFRRMRRFAPALVAGWITEEFARTADDCRHATHAEALEQIAGKLRRFMPGDGYSDLHWRAAIHWEAIDPVLVPVWVFAVRYRQDEPPLRVVINGQTGRLSGRVPLSWPRVIAAAIIVAAVVAAIAWGLA
jgi:hypothetical protein